MLVRTMIQEAGCDVGTKAIVWVKVNPEYEILIRLMDGQQPDAGRHYWIAEPDAGELIEQIATEVEIPSPLSHNTLTIVEEYVQ